MDSDEGAYETEPTTFGPAHAVTLSFIIEVHEHTLRNATTPHNTTFVTTLNAQFNEHIRTTLYHLRSYVLHQQALIHIAYPIHQRSSPTTTVPRPPNYT
jgi:hypothetical protein